MSDESDASADDDLWESVEHLQDWLARTQPERPAQETLLLRMLKLSEEVGEVAEAVIGATGQNPRKGVSHTWDDVRSELCDVIITAAVALRTLTPEAREVFTTHLTHVTTRTRQGHEDPRTQPSPTPQPKPRSPQAP
ncbi:MazG-like family protein [Streptomyces tauricus]|uniref:MazG-like family protein n=1 Tax=Streptomyces tauricus TaxID=68274 RepID=A0ABZ1JKI6_9ACTN|nr:MazG-like family protein [Streptomyces tauricus]